MPELKIHLKMSGSEPSEWFESEVTNDSGMTKVPVKKTGSGTSGFLASLAEKVKALFEQTITDAKPAGYTGVKVNIAPTVADVAAIDLLCYVCRKKSDSVFQAKEPEIFTKAPQNTGGITARIPAGKVGKGTLSEIYVDQYNDNITCVSFGIYHEFMHNKTRWGIEDIEWPHRSGGGGVALEEGPLSFYRPNKTNKQQIATRLSTANAQYTAGL